jgi:hypothetical protein
MDIVEPPGGGPPRHTHEAEDEFVVLEGEVTFDVDGCVSTVTAGGSAFVPRGVPHCFRNRSTSDVRLLVMFTPGTAEGFFEYGLPVDGARPSEQHPCERMCLRQVYGIRPPGTAASAFARAHSRPGRRIFGRCALSTCRESSRSIPPRGCR